MLDPIDITGALVTADAAHTCADTARYLVEDKNADYLLTIKGNRAVAARRRHRRRPRADRAEPGHVTDRTRPWPDQPLDHLDHLDHRAGNSIGLPVRRPPRASSAATSPTWPGSRPAKKSSSSSPAAPG